MKKFNVTTKKVARDCDGRHEYDSKTEIKTHDELRCLIGSATLLYGSATVLIKDAYENPHVTDVFCHQATDEGFSRLEIMFYEIEEDKNE